MSSIADPMAFPRDPASRSNVSETTPQRLLMVASLQSASSRASPVSRFRTSTLARIRVKEYVVLVFLSDTLRRRQVDSLD
jgi:hypothetical protein